MAEKIRVYQAAKELGISEEETMRLLNVGKVITVHDRGFGQQDASDKQIAVGRTRLSYVATDEVEALKRRLGRASKSGGEKRIHAAVVRRGEKVQSAPPEPMTVIVLNTETAALFSLTEPTGKAVAPQRIFQVQISPPLTGIKAIHSVGGKLTAIWSKAPAVEVNISKMLRAIVDAACEHLAQKRAARPKKEPNPIGPRDAFMREEITVKIETELSKKLRKSVADVVSGRRGYSNVLKESIAVRAHPAKYHVGSGRKDVKTVVRAAHRRGPKTGEQKARKYKIKA